MKPSVRYKLFNANIWRRNNDWAEYQKLAIISNVYLYTTGTSNTLIEFSGERYLWQPYNLINHFFPKTSFKPEWYWPYHGVGTCASVLTLRCSHIL